MYNNNDFCKINEQIFEKWLQSQILCDMIFRANHTMAGTAGLWEAI